MEAGGQDVDQEAADELARRQGHQLAPGRSVGAVVLPLKRDALLVHGDQTAIGDGDAMGVAGEIGQHGLGPGEGALAIDDPFHAPQRDQVGGEGGAVSQAGVLAEEDQPPLGVGGGELVQEQAAEQAREHAHRQEEAGAAGDPALAVGRQAAAGHDAVHMRMVGER